MEKHYGYSREIEKKIKRYGWLGAVYALIAMITMTILYYHWELEYILDEGVLTIAAVFNIDRVEVTAYALFGVLWVVVILVYFIDVYRLEEARANLVNCYLELTPDLITGFGDDDISKRNNGAYFELLPKEIRKIYITTPNIVLKKLYNLRIDHTKGTIWLAIDQNEEVKHKLEKFLQNIPPERSGVSFSDQKPKQQQWRCGSCGNMIDQTPCPVCGDQKPCDPVPRRAWENKAGRLVCPNCKTEQDSHTNSCRSCGQVFINGQPGIPYWCGKCGAEGPFEGNCPHCGSGMKVMNI